MNVKRLGEENENESELAWVGGKIDMGRDEGGGGRILGFRGEKFWGSVEGREGKGGERFRIGG